MSENPVAVETDERGDQIERDESGQIVKIVSHKGKATKEYVARNLSMKADAETVRAVEDYRWSNQLTVADVLTLAVTEFLANNA